MSESSTMALQVETLKQIQKTAVEAAGVGKRVDIREVPAERARKYMIIGQDGQHQLVDAPPPDRSHVLRSLAEFPAYLGYAAARLSAKPVVWYTEHGVFAVLDDSIGSYRSDHVRLQFERTPEFDWLKNAADDGSQVMSQKDLVFLLRSILSACATPSSAELLKVARTLQSQTGITAAGKVENHRESVGRDIEHEIRSDAGEIPEWVDFRCRVLTDPLLRYESVIKCMVEIDPRTLAIQLFPRPEDIRTALEETRSEIDGYLDRECAGPDCQVFFGSPS